MATTKTTSIDSAGRLVIPKEIREAAGLAPGAPLVVRHRGDHVEIEPAPLEVQIEMRGRVAVAVPKSPVPRVTTEEVEKVRRQLRKEREDRSR